MANYTVKRNVTKGECHWLNETVKQGEIVYDYTGPTYGCVGSGKAVTRSPNGEVPFFELPHDALIKNDASVLPFTRHKETQARSPNLNIDENPVKYPGVNAVTVCDCGQYEFMVGLEVMPMGGNYIRCLECTSCGKQMQVPFFDVDQLQEATDE